jgi:hypothetical protein
MGLLTLRGLPLGLKIARSVLVLCVGVVPMMSPTSTLACSCPPVEHACEAYTATPIIFTGTVVSLGARETTSNRASYSQTIQFDVNEPFKGTRTDAITIKRVHVPSSCSSSTPEFVVGRQYLVWANDDESGIPIVSDCTATRPLEEAAQFVSDLRELRAGRGATYIFGNVYRNRIPPNGVRPEELQDYSSLPLPGTRVKVSSPESSYTVIADQQGHFVVPLARGGNYRVNMDLPKYFIQEGLDREIGLENHECVDMSWWAQYAFPFVGRVVDMHGVPIAGVPVELLSTEKLDSFVHTFTDKDGKYELSASEPGDYLIAVNWDEPPSEEAPIATTLYPGGHNIETASRVHTEEGGPVALADFRLPTATKCTVQIQIEPSSAKSTTGTKILTKYFPEQFWHPVADVDPSGRALVTVIGPNLSYLVASRPLSDQQELRSAVKTIHSCPTGPIRLRLTNTIQID